MNYGSEFRNKSSSVNQGDEEEVADGLSDNSSRFPKDGFPQLCERSNILDMSKYITKYVSRRTYSSESLIETCT